MSNYHHGVRVFEINEGSRPIRTLSTAVIGIVCTGDDADADFFPLDTPKLVLDAYEALSKAGNTGTLAPTLNAIASQCQAPIIVVRVQEADSEDEQTANVIGRVTEANKYTGVKALLVAGSKYQIEPRILAAPGLDNASVTNALISVAQELRAFVYASAWNCQNKEEAVAYRQKFGARELMLIWPDFLNFNPQKAREERVAATAYAVGLRAKIDQEQGWNRCLSNIPINGINGISKDISFKLQSATSDANYLNSKEITTLVQFKGFRFWGSRTCSADPLFSFESYTRTAHVLADSLAEGMFFAIDGVLKPKHIKDIFESISAKGRELVRDEYLLGFEAWIDKQVNTKESIKSGKYIIDYDYTPCPPLESLELRQRITDRFLLDFNAATVTHIQSIPKN